MVLAHTLHNESDLCQDADDVSKALLSSPSASRCLLTSTTVLGTCLLVQKYLLTSTKVQILTSRSLAPMSLEQLKLLAVERGVKREGVGWAACCPPAGSKADIVRAVRASQYGFSQDSQNDPQVLYMFPHATMCVLILL